MPPLVVRSERVVLPDGIRAGGDPHSRRADRRRSRGHADRRPASDAIDAGELVVMPGLVDTHVHINDPGRADWEGFEHATRAAAAGGVTTLVDMPLNSIPATTDGRRRLEAKRARRDGPLPRRRRLLGRRRSRQRRRSRAARARAASSASSASCRRPASTSSSTSARRTCARRCRCSRGSVCRCSSMRSCRTGSCVRIARMRSARVRDLAGAAVRRAAEPARNRAADRPGARVRRRASTSSISRPPDALAADRDCARRRACAITVETCPHYLTFAAEEIADGATAFKCAPPIRERAQSRAAVGGRSSTATSIWSPPITRRRRRR